MEDSIKAAIGRSGYQTRKRVGSSFATFSFHKRGHMGRSICYYGSCSFGISNSTRWFHFLAPSNARLPYLFLCGNRSESVRRRHSLPPKSLVYHAQLYCVHGVCSQGVEIPLVYCITSKKTQNLYVEIF
ncbi:hypothetical protein OSTOST_02981, partial [Ostertagia ostertagi]